MSQKSNPKRLGRIVVGVFAGASIPASAEIVVSPADLALVQTMPLLSIEPASPIGAGIVDRTVYTRTLPGVARDEGRASAMGRLVSDPVKRSHAVGHLAEEDF